MKFEPIAIVGQGCVLPGALSPAELWEAVGDGRDLLSSAPLDRWGMSRRHAMGTPDHAGDRTWSDRGGYVQGFEKAFDPTGFGLPADAILGLDPLFQWVLHAAREALRDARVSNGKRVGAVFGNLSFPSAAMSRFAERVWLGDELADAAAVPRVDPRNRFMSGLPAHLLGRALNLGDSSYAVDAACASSLYALKLACDRLHDRRADVMLAGAVNRSDDLFIHVGFCALRAMSKTGRSRPFHQHADGLVPAEGAGFVALKRLADAIAAGDDILGVVRGIGLSNDGRGKGFLAPASEGQKRAMRLAYEMSGLTPADISLLECHATGTSVGDLTEVESMAEIYRGRTGVPIGSLKSNLGHLITAAGVAGLIKVLGAMRARILPPGLHTDAPLEALADSPFRLLDAPESWESNGPRRAGLSSFGFGGNNAHVLVEEHAPRQPAVAVSLLSTRPVIAVVAIGARVGDGVSTADFRRSLFAAAATPRGRAATITLPVTGLKFPPADLKQSLPQQLLLLAAAQEALAATHAERERTGVIVGMGCDPNVARYGARWRLADWAEAWGTDDHDWTAAARDAVIPLLQAPGVLGTMPNIPANRLNSQFDLGGPSLTVSAEELSGIRALEIAVRALAYGEMDAAVVGAVDLSDEPVHRAALAALGLDRVAGDAAIVLVLKRLDDARAGGDTVLAVLAPNDDGDADVGSGEVVFQGAAIAARFGEAHAAFGLLQVAAAVLACAHGKRIGGGEWAGPRRARVETEGLGGATATIRVLAADSTPLVPTDPPLPTGHLLEFPAHQPEITLPALPASHPTTVFVRPLEAPAGAAQVMRPAPRLAPVLEADGLPGAPPRPTPVKGPHPATATPAPAGATRAPTAAPPAAPRLAATPAASRPAPSPHAAAKPAVTSPPAASAAPAASGVAETAGGPFVNDDPTAAILAQHHASLVAAHDHFLALQRHTHEQFLRLREKTQRDMLAVYQQMQLGGEPIGPTMEVAKVAPPPLPAASAHNVVRFTPPTHRATATTTPTMTPPKPVAAPATILPGLKLDREGLKVHATGRISEIFGPLFAKQDGYQRQVRMPEPPLLLADRVTGLAAEPGSMKTGTIWTETDVARDSWYLHEGRMPAGVMIEAGQADLMLISYLGIDFLNKSDRVYRLLGCELTYSGGLPQPGETLAYDIHVDGHANQGDIRLFFFHYDCKVNGANRLSVRAGQAGFFTDAELADSMGILWEPQTGEHTATPRLDPPFAECSRTRFSRAQIEAYAAGRVLDCFGPGFELACTHTRTPRISGGRMLFLEEVTHLQRGGGPWGRGYLRAIDNLTPDDWFFQGHFKNDPCMPGTLMFEGCLQAMAFYMASLGYTLDRDGWRFEPVPDETYSLRCRGQVLPSSKELIYEIFVEEVIDGPYPTLYADLLCTADGLKGFHCRRMGLRLVPSWPLDSRPELLEGPLNQRRGPIAEVDGFKFDYASLLACAWGKPSHAFGEMYRPFDDTRRVARLPGPPYHFLSRVTKVVGPIGVPKPGASIELEYDIPHDEWYFSDNGHPTMPFAVLLEAALQPCGWLASYVGSARTTETDLFFRNLDGTGTLHVELLPTSGTLRTKVKSTNISASAGMLIESFDVACVVVDDHGTETPVYDLKTVFGFFPAEALANQVGLPVDATERAFFDKPSDYRLDLTTRPPKYCGGTCRLATPFLLMIDRVTGNWPAAGAAGLGQYRAEKEVDPDEWFFKAHFFQDPVQPGSLGIEALLQLLQFAMLDRGMHEGMESPRFEPLALAIPMTWKYRGQVRIHNKVISSTIELTAVGEDARGRFAIAVGSLWVDGKRIYETKNMGMRIVSDRTATPPGSGERATAVPTSSRPPEATRATPASTTATVEVLDPARDRWLGDHRPTWSVPALPMMSMVDRLATAAKASGSGEVVGLKDVQVLRWLPIPRATTIRADVQLLKDGAHRVTLKNDAGAIAVGTVTLADGWPEPPAPLRSLDVPFAADPYAAATLFHGPAFQVLKSLRLGVNGSTALLDANGAGLVPPGTLNQLLLDGATHGIPHDRLDLWTVDISRDDVAYPAMIPAMTLYGPTPRTGEVRCETRFDGFHGGPRFPAFNLELIQDNRVWATIRLVEALFPKGPIGRAEPVARRKFLRDRRFVDGVLLSRAVDGQTRLNAKEVAGSDWLPGTIAALYGTSDVAAVAEQEHIARTVKLHPGAVRMGLPCNRVPVAIGRDGDDVVVQSAGPEVLDLLTVRGFWREWFGIGPWPIEDVYFGLAARFVRRVVIEDPDAFDAVRGRGVLYLANHQVGVESLLFSIIVGALHGIPAATIAKHEHRETWLGRLIAHGNTWPGMRDPGSIVFFEREDPASLPRILQQLAEQMAANTKSVMIHAQGTRSLNCRRQPVEQMSGVSIELAAKVGAPIVPIRFVGGLPVEAMAKRIEFPIGMGSQDYWIGRPILPAELASLPYGERTKYVLEQVNGVGPGWQSETPNPPNPTFAALVAEWVADHDVSHEHATIWRALETATDPCAETTALVAAIRSGDIAFAADAKGAWLTELARRLRGESA